MKLEKELMNKIDNIYTKILTEVMSTLSNMLELPYFNINIVLDNIFTIVENYTKTYETLLDDYVEKTFKLSQDQHNSLTELIIKKETTDTILKIQDTLPNNIATKSLKKQLKKIPTTIKKLIDNLKNKLKPKRTQPKTNTRIRVKTYRSNIKNKLKTRTFSNRITQKIQKVITKNTKEIKQSTPKTKKDILSKLKNNIREVLKRDAKTTAQNTIQNAKQHETYTSIMQDQDVEYIEWVTAGDDKVRDTHAAQEGYIQIKGEPFPNGLLYPGDPNGPPEEIYNCRCDLIPATLDDYNSYHNITSKT